MYELQFKATLTRMKFYDWCMLKFNVVQITEVKCLKLAQIFQCLEDVFLPVNNSLLAKKTIIYW